MILVERLLRAPLFALSLLILTGSLVWCQTDAATTRVLPRMANDPNKVALGAGDTLVITLLGENEVSKNWIISQSGDLNLPYVGRVPVAGRTVMEIEQDLVERFKQYLRNPLLTASVAELRSRPVTVNGAVKNPGIYQVDGGVTLFQLLALAGGVEEAGTSVKLTRPKSGGIIDLPGAKWTEGGSEMQLELSLRDVLRADGPAANIELKPNDVVNVEKTRSRLIYVAGEVTTPGAIQLDTTDSIYITQALAMVGGYKTTGAMDKALLWSCCDSDQKAQLTTISLKKILEGKAEDQKLKEGDYLVVPPKTGINWVATVAMITGIISSTGTLAIISRR